MVDVVGAEKVAGGPLVTEADRPGVALRGGTDTDSGLLLLVGTV